MLCEKLRGEHVVVEILSVRMVLRNKSPELVELFLGLVLLPQQSVYDSLAKVRPEIPRLSPARRSRTIPRRAPPWTTVE